jgi:hypothetical protein
MELEDTDTLQAAVDARLVQIAAACTAPPSWFGAWYRLRPESAHEDRLSVYQEVRDSGAVPREAGFFLVSWVIDAITMILAEEALQEQQAQLEEIKGKYGLEPDEAFAENEAPEDYQQAEMNLAAAWNELYAETLDSYNETEMAQLCRQDRQRYEQIADAGRRYFMAARAAASDLSWLTDLGKHVAGCIEPEAPMGAPALQYREGDDQWDVTIYPTGAEPGAKVPGFALDLEQLRAPFDQVANSGWNAGMANEPDGPFIFIDGIYRGHRLVLRILTQKPPEQAAGAPS